MNVPLCVCLYHADRRLGWESRSRQFSREDLTLSCDCILTTVHHVSFSTRTLTQDKTGCILSIELALDVMDACETTSGFKEVSIHYPAQVTSNHCWQGVVNHLPVLVVSFEEYDGSWGVDVVAWDLGQLSASVIHLVLATWVRLPREPINAGTTNTKSSEWEGGKERYLHWYERSNGQSPNCREDCWFVKEVSYFYPPNAVVSEARRFDHH